MSKTTMSKNEIEQKIRDLKTKLSCQESDIGDWKIAKCIEYSTLGMESPYDLQELHKQRQVIRDEIGALEEELAKCEDEDEAASEKQALFTKLLSKKAEGFSLRFVLINTGNISRKVLSKVLRSFDKNFERLQLAQYSPYIAIPKVSSQNRRYIPMDYLEGEIIPGDKLFTMPSATSYEFGILMSNVHMAWTRAVCGRLKSDYSYSNMIVYNNFPWPSPTNDQKEKIRKTAQAILNARALYTDSNLADLYDPLTMPTELLKAHKANNRAVMHAYGFSIKMSEADCVAELMRMYQKLTKEK